jgi:hypothetical protein
MGASENDVVQVTVNVTPSAPRARGFSDLLILGTAAVLPLSGRVRLYADLPAVDVDFATTDEEYKAAAIWFSQQPRPTSVKIGRRFTGAQHGQLRGADVHATLLSAFTAVTNGGLDITIDGVLKQLTGIDLSGAASMAAVAADLQTALAAAVASTTCTWDGAHFIVGSPTTGTSSVIGYAVTPTGGGSPTDISTLLGLEAGGGAQSYSGIAAESVTAAWNASAVFDPAFYGVAIASTTVQDIKDTMAFAETGVYLHAYTVTDPAAKLTATTTDLFSYAKSQGYQNSFGMFNGGSPYAAIGALAKQLLVDLTKPASAINMKFQQLHGIAVDSSLTSTEIAALKAKNANYYTTFAAPGSTSDFSMFAEGVCGDGSWIDQVFNLAFAQARLQAAYFGVLVTAGTKIEQTDHGVQRIVQALDKEMAILVAANVLAPGVWLGDDVGEVKSGQFLQDGYYTYATPVVSQSQGDRDARIAPPITILGTGAGAINSGSVQFNFQQ